MATSSPPAGPSMRQQLDELDALLQRMLTLPNSQSEGGHAEPYTNGRAPAPEPAEVHTNGRAPEPQPGVVRGPRMILLDGSAPVTPPATPPAAWDPHWNINLNPQNGSSILGPRSPTATLQRSQSDAVPPVWRAETIAFSPPRTEPVPQPPLSTGVAQEPMPAEESRPRDRVEVPAPLPLLPLVGLNRIFDGVASCFGPPGQWFCTTAGRNMLGFVGLLLLGGGMAWGAVELFGWPR